MTVLVRIKRAVLAGRFELSEKARIEMFADGLFEQDLVQAIASAKRIDKTLRTSSPFHRRRERLYVIISDNLLGARLYTKGKFVELDGVETYYFFISAKCSD
ncbi:MAG: hypothetical protein ABSF29_08960 [Tepidisphaeraceae bacterium]|jgi:hypothetical protein